MTLITEDLDAAPGQQQDATDAQQHDAEGASATGSGERVLRLLAAWAATRPAPPLADLHADSQPEQHATPILLPILRTSASLARHVLLHAHPTRVTLDSSSAHAIPRLLPMHASHLALTLKGPFPDDDDGGHAFAAALAEGVAHLLAHASRLELSGAALTPALLAALGQRTSERLQELALVDCALPEQLDDGSAAAAAAGDAGAAAVGAAVPAAPPPFGGSSLERLVVRRCHVGPPEQAPWGMSVRKPPLRAVRVATALVPAAQLRTLDTDAWVWFDTEALESSPLEAWLPALRCLRVRDRVENLRPLLDHPRLTDVAVQLYPSWTTGLRPWPKKEALTCRSEQVTVQDPDYGPVTQTRFVMKLKPGFSWPEHALREGFRWRRLALWWPSGVRLSGLPLSGIDELVVQDGIELEAWVPEPKDGADDGRWTKLASAAEAAGARLRCAPDAAGRFTLRCRRHFIFQRIYESVASGIANERLASEDDAYGVLDASDADPEQVLSDPAFQQRLQRSYALLAGRIVAALAFIGAHLQPGGAGGAAGCRVVVEDWGDGDWFGWMEAEHRGRLEAALRALPGDRVAAWELSAAPNEEMRQSAEDWEARVGFTWPPGH